MSTSRSAARRFERTDLAAAEVAVSRADLKKTENQVAVHVHRLYFAVLIAELQKRAAAERVAYAACSGYFTEMRRRAKAATPSSPRPSPQNVPGSGVADASPYVTGPNPRLFGPPAPLSSNTTRVIASPPVAAAPSKLRTPLEGEQLPNGSHPAAEKVPKAVVPSYTVNATV